MTIETLAHKAGDSTWRKVGEKALVTAVTTLITEAIKASVELMKKAKLREQKAEFDDRRARQKKDDEPAGGEAPDEEAVDEADDSDEESDDDEETDAADSEDGSDDGPEDEDAPESGGPAVDFASYIAKQR
ncbi:MAG: hypothetical protein ACOC9W_03505 [Persicimonas sp.]